MQGEQGIVAHVKLPHANKLDEYDKLELDFTLSCPGTSNVHSLTVRRPFSFILETHSVLRLEHLHWH